LDGTKLERSNRWQSDCAIHSASFTSVLRPGTFLTCWHYSTQVEEPTFVTLILSSASSTKVGEQVVFKSLHFGKDNVKA
jgi:hypothetical protein